MLNENPSSWFQIFKEITFCYKTANTEYGQLHFFFFYKLQTTISESNPTVINYINLYFCTPYAIPMGVIWLHLN
jgi:hypothetical protein